LRAGLDGSEYTLLRYMVLIAIDPHTLKGLGRSAQPGAQVGPREPPGPKVSTCAIPREELDDAVAAIRPDGPHVHEGASAVVGKAAVLVWPLPVAIARAVGGVDVAPDVAGSLEGFVGAVEGVMFSSTCAG
jgi:hypothetical protein